MTGIAHYNHAAPLAWTPAAYEQAFTHRRPVRLPDDAHLRGRILRDIPGEQGSFEYLAKDSRELVFILGPDGLNELPGHHVLYALGRIGLTPNYVQGRIRQGYEFKLAVFEDEGDAPLATWDNALDMIADRHPELAPDIQAHRGVLETTPFEVFAQRMPFDIDDVDLAGPAHQEFMNAERYRAIPAALRQSDPIYLRRLLLHGEHLNTLFDGTGYTKTPDGEQGLKEYMRPNARIASLPGVVVIDLPIY